MQDPQIVVVSGPPGAGKSSVAEALCARFDRTVLVDGDQFFRSVREGRVPPWTAEADHQNETVIRAIGGATGRYRAGGYFVVVDAVIGPWFLGAFVDEVAAPVSYVILRPSAEVVMGRAMSRATPELTESAPIAQMYRSFEQLGEFERFVLDTTRHDVTATADAVAAVIGDATFTVSPRR